MIITSYEEFIDTIGEIHSFYEWWDIHNRGQSTFGGYGIKKVEMSGHGTIKLVDPVNKEEFAEIGPDHFNVNKVIFFTELEEKELARVLLKF